VAQPFCTGPVAIWAGVGIGGLLSGAGLTPTFLGHSERPPRIQVRPRYSPVYVDLSGTQTPFDFMYEGQDAIISADLIRFNWPVFNLLANRAQTVATFPGIDDPGAIGTLAGTEAAGPSGATAFPLWMQFPYAAKAAFATGFLPPCYHFYQCILEGPDDITSGTVPHKVHCVWHAWPQFQVGTINAFGTGRFALFDYNAAAIAGLPIN
jgi:hypothetical protein